MHSNHELMAAVEVAGRYYSHELMTGQGPGHDAARRYVSGRRVFGPMIEQFRIGYVPKTSFGRPWIANKITDRNLLLDAGLVNEGENGLYDPMEGRVVFPQTNPAGKFLGFVGRDIAGGSPDKYLSTGATPIFRRAEVLYRIDRARRAIEQERTVIVVEGLLDAVLLNQVGVKNAVATGTKAMTDAQAQILSRYAHFVEVMFDNDEAGRAGFEELRKRRGEHFKRVAWREYPAKFNDPADWVAERIDRLIADQGAVVKV